MTRERRLWANVYLIFLVRITCCAYVLCVPTLVRYWQLHGMTLSQVTLLQSIFAVSLALGQGPTGYFADVFTRRRSICVGAFFNVVGVALYIHAQAFNGFLVAEISTSIGLSFISGADRAVMYESLSELGHGGRFTEFWGRAVAITQAWQAGAAAVGGFLATRDMVYPFYGVAVLMSLQWCVALSLLEPVRAMVTAGKRMGREFLRILSVCWSEPRLRGLLACSTVLTACNQAGLWLYQPYFEHCGLPLAWWGMAFGIYNLVASIASWFSPRLEVRERSLVGGMVASVTFGYFLMGVFNPMYGFLFAVFHQVVRGTLQARIGSAITKAAPDQVRATVGSIEAMGFTLLYSMLVLPVGWHADHYGLSSTLLDLACLTAVLGGAVVAWLPSSERDIVAASA